MAFGNKLGDLINKTAVDCINSFVNRILTNPCFLLPYKGTKQALKLSLVFTFNDSVRIFKFRQVKSKLDFKNLHPQALRRTLYRKQRKSTCQLFTAQNLKFYVLANLSFELHGRVFELRTAREQMAFVLQKS